MTLQQLAWLFEEARRSNAAYDASRKAGQPREVPNMMREACRVANQTYDAARRKYKRLQKADNRADMRTTMIRFYLDQQEVHA